MKNRKQILTQELTDMKYLRDYIQEVIIEEKRTMTYDVIIKKAIKKDLEENGVTKIIKREIFNHELVYFGLIDTTYNYLKDYGVSKQQIRYHYVRMRHILNPYPGSELLKCDI